VGIPMPVGGLSLLPTYIPEIDLSPTIWDVAIKKN
jgi:hypothetical protein